MRVLIVEDEVLLAELIREGLEEESIGSDLVHDGERALELVALNTYDVVLLDRDIPGVHGDEVCRRIVAHGYSTRILMLTAARRTDQKVDGFAIGADDYLAKPFDFPELVARVRALARRSGESLPPILQTDDLRLDTFRHEVYRGGSKIRLARKEFALLEVLMAADGGVVSAEQLIDRAWDERLDPFSNAVRVTMSTLRKKLGEPQIIGTVAGVGYRMLTP